MKANRSFIVLAVTLLALTLGLSACFPGVPRVVEPVSTSAIHTAAAATIIAEATLSAGQTAVAQLTQMAQGGQPSATPLPPTAQDTEVVEPTTTNTPFVPTPTNTFVPPSPTAIPPTATQIYIPPTAIPVYPTNPPPPPQVACDWAQYVADVTIPDNTRLAPNQPFTKIWRLRNIGSCIWTPQYALVFVSGDRMQAQRVIGLPRNVRPGETIDLGVDLVAPEAPGDYRGYWMLVNPRGQEFGIGNRATTAFWVDVQVERNVTSRYPFDFVASVCNASWDNGSRGLSCPGNTESPNGSVTVLNAPVLETGKHENEPALWTRPEAARNGAIAGQYPAYRVQNGDHFMSDIGCLENSRSCDVVFALHYKIAGQPVRSLGTWREVYDGRITRVDVDLSSLAGERVQFILQVVNQGGANAAANAFWLVPSIRNTSGGGGGVPPADGSAVTAARQTLAAGLGINPNRLTTVSVENVYWPDACLGIPQPGRTCAQVVTYGLRVILAVDNQFYEVHTNENGSVVYWFGL